jgi:hypothetical protein
MPQTGSLASPSGWRRDIAFGTSLAILRLAPKLSRAYNRDRLTTAFGAKGPSKGSRR